MYEPGSVRVLRAEKLPIVLIAVTTVVRLIYGVAVNDPFSGPDAPTYGPAAADLKRDGLFAEEVTGIPYWPAGYPIFVWLFYVPFGVEPRVAMAGQVLLLALGTWAAYTLVRRELGPRVALVTLVLLCLSPALLAASSELMYETVLLSMLAVSLDLVSRSVREAGRRRLWLAVAGAFALGISATMQPKVLLPAVLVLAWLLVRAGPTSAKARLVLAVTCSVALLVPPVGLGVRTEIATGEFGLSGNLGTTWSSGVDDADEAPECSTESSEPIERDRDLSGCLAEWAVSHPLEMLSLAPEKAYEFWAPMVGPRREGTWLHAFNFRRLVPASIEDKEAFGRADRLGSDLWTAGTVALVLGGLVIALADPRRRAGALLIAVPLAGFLAVSLVTIGDPRFRLPVAPFYAAFMAVALVALADRVVRRRAARISASPAPVAEAR